MLGLKLNHVSKRGHWSDQAIYLTNVDLSPMVFHGIPLKVMALDILLKVITTTRLKIIH